MPKTKHTPTTGQFTAYQAMYDYFNAALFEGKLAPVLLNFSRKAGTYGFFAPARWQAGKVTAHEISLNPQHLGRTSDAVAATLVHEMVHAWQQEHGKPSRRGYHNAEWANRMEAVGLMPSDTAQPGGKRVGDRVSHYIMPDGPFAKSFKSMPKSILLPWVSFDDSEVKKKRPASKVKYTCPSCEMNVWGKPGLHVKCGDCKCSLDAGEGTDGEP